MGGEGEARFWWAWFPEARFSESEYDARYEENFLIQSDLPENWES
jgi:hypothetical protein